MENISITNVMIFFLEILKNLSIFKLHINSSDFHFVSLLKSDV